MAIRHPPDDNVPRVIRRSGMPPPRVIRYDGSEPGFLRRLLRFLLRPYIVIPVTLVAVLADAVVGHFNHGTARCSVGFDQRMFRKVVEEHSTARADNRTSVAAWIPGNS